MSKKIDSRFKTMRHIETVRNYLNVVIRELLNRAEQHDQSKLQEPELEGFDRLTNSLRNSTYGSDEYEGFKKELKSVLEHHYSKNRHHPEHFDKGIQDMNLIDIIEMLIDWKCSSMRHNDGNILKSIKINQDRFGYSDELKTILENTAKWLDTCTVYHKADES